MQKTTAELDAEMLFALERERAEVARSLRAETVQVLASVLVGLAALERLDDLEAIRATVGDLRQVVREDLEQVQRRASEIRPSVLDDFGLTAAVRATVEALTACRGPAIDLEWPEAPQRLKPEQELLLFRIIQEALRNAVRHAGARQISVRMSREGSLLRLEVQDDGHGFDRERQGEKSPAGYGIRLMQTQAQILGGALEVDSRPGRGTTICLRLPLEREY